MIDWQPLEALAVARTETTVGQFRRYVQATGAVTEAERRGGGEVYEAGWTRQPGWTWRAPYGSPAADDEPAVHLTWHEAQAFCRWAGGRLPRDDEWARAAYTEQRPAPPPPWRRGQTYRYPTGDSPQGATGNAPRRTRGGSWWYGEGPMRAEHRQDKPAGTAVVYIGFRCVR